MKRIDLSILGTNLRSYRVAHGWSLRDAERESGVSNAYISQIENGRSEPSLSMLDQLSSAYGFSISDVLRWTGTDQQAMPRRQKSFHVTVEIDDLRHFDADVLAKHLTGSSHFMPDIGVTVEEVGTE